MGIIPSFLQTGEADEATENMVSAANQFITSLSAEQKESALYGFKDKKRITWNFLPDKFIPDVQKRFGLPFTKMTPVQQILAHGLLSSGLSSQGYLKAVTIMTLEQILHDLEEQNPIRNPHLYYVSIFGEPSNTGNWSWRFEGHHLSVNVTITHGDKVSVTPSFFGTNPGEVTSGLFKGLKVLKQEEELARELVGLLTEEQRKTAIIANTAPRDVITGADIKVDRNQFDPALGIAYADLTGNQRKILFMLLKSYAYKYRPEFVDQITERAGDIDENKVFFAMAGDMTSGKGHYYRIQGPTFLIEYDNTQNQANHVHSVWRDFDGDFGEDLLKKHHEAIPHEVAE